jgi:hypothetical protein
MSKAQFLAENLKDGEIYAGLILGEEGQPDYHLALLPAKPENRLNWSNALAWAASVGGDLPTRNEQSLLFANCKVHFVANWYWSNAQDAANPGYAWVQHFNDGGQDHEPKSHECRARAVRRILIIE